MDALTSLVIALAALLTLNVAALDLAPVPRAGSGARRRWRNARK